MFSGRSKYNHLFGKTLKANYDNVKASDSAWDGNFIAANPKYFAVVWKTGGGGAFAVIPHSKTGRLPADLPLFAAHTRPVLDVAFSPFHDQVIASGSEDNTVKLWSIPEEGTPSAPVLESLTTLTQHSKKVGLLLFHPSASNVLMTAAADPSIKIWDIEKGLDKVTLTGFGDLIHSADWNQDGSLVGTTSRDKKIRIFDARSGSVVSEVDGHQGSKASRLVFLHGKNRIFTTGFSKSSDRQYAVYDDRNLSTPLVAEDIDKAAGVLMPFYDSDTGVLFVAAKGEALIRLFDTEKEKPTILTPFSEGEPLRGCCMMPKRALDIEHNEVARILKLTRNNTVDPIRFEVPRKAEGFQADIFPDTASGEAALSADEWFDGKNSLPNTVSLDFSGGQPRKAAPQPVQTFAPVQPKPQSAPVKAPASTAPAAPAAQTGKVSPQPTSSAELDAANARIQQLEKENRMLKDSIAGLQSQISQLQGKSGGSVPDVPIVANTNDASTTEDSEWGSA
eukprot:TRINITY_DN2469_c0_g1_i1.p1 TRINITY_DN2469_c0_g1~~TRINITY_DN2469_c0_g1_i1.p1  ORF type:complete len:506 (-),score=122.46 TRINITY_DN2469_c0_g1_i1:101-1618(-)